MEKRLQNRWSKISIWVKVAYTDNEASQLKSMELIAIFILLIRDKPNTIMKTLSQASRAASVSSPVAIRAAMTAAPTTSAGRFSPLGHFRHQKLAETRSRQDLSRIRRCEASLTLSSPILSSFRGSCENSCRDQMDAVDLRRLLRPHDVPPRKAGATSQCRC